MQYKLQLLIVLFAILAAVSCSDDDNPISGIRPTVTGSGIRITEERTLPEFSSVVMNTMGDVDIQWLDRFTVPFTLTVDDNIMPFITSNITNGVLVIDSDQTKRLEDFDLTVVLGMTSLERVTLAGVGSITSYSLGFSVDHTIEALLTGVGDIYLKVNAPDVTAVLLGAGTIRMTGQPTNFKGILSGAGRLEMFSLYADTAVVNLSGSGEVEVSVFDQLTAAISGEGSIYYKEDPTVYETITGNGRVVDVD